MKLKNILHKTQAISLMIALILGWTMGLGGELYRWITVAIITVILLANIIIEWLG